LFSNSTATINPVTKCCTGGGHLFVFPSLTEPERVAGTNLRNRQFFCDIWGDKKQQPLAGPMLIESGRQSTSIDIFV
jgi:hypothetical protein